MADRAAIIAELKSRSQAGQLSPEELERFRPILLEEARARKLAEATPQETPSEGPGGAQPSPGTTGQGEGEIVGPARALSAAGGVLRDPVRAGMNALTGEDTFQAGAMARPGPQDMASVDQRVKELESIPELFTLRVGGKHQVNAGRAFLDSIGYLGLDGDDKVLQDLRGRLEKVSKVASALENPANLEKVINAELAPFNVDTERMGDAVLINFDDPLTGERHVAWANKPGFSGRDAVSLMNTAFEGASLLAGGGIMKWGTKTIRQAAKLRARKLYRDPKGRFTSKGSRKRARQQAKDDAAAAAAAETKPKSKVGDIARVAAEEAVYTMAGAPGAAVVSKYLTGGTPLQLLQSGLRSRAKIRRLDRERRDSRR